MSDEAATSTSAPKPSLTSSLLGIARVLQRYTLFWFVLLLVLVYSFVLLRIQTAASAQPSQAAIDVQLHIVTTPHVDSEVIDQIQSLQDHSVNVKTLFDQARSNPFKE